MSDDKYIANEYLFWGPTPVIIGLPKRSLFLPSFCWLPKISIVFNEAYMKKSNCIISFVALWAMVALVLSHRGIQAMKGKGQNVPSNSQLHQRKL